MNCLGVLALATLVAAPPVAMAGTLVNASPGYVYYHRTGADMATHDAAVDDCIQKAASLAAPYTPSGWLPGLLEIHIDSVMFRANLENCMVAKGWDVVRVPDDEGKRIAATPQAQQAGVLSSWVGAAEVHGEVVRRFEPLSQLWREVRPHSPLLDANPPRPLSVTAGVHDLRHTRYAPQPTDMHLVKAAPDDAVLAPGASVIVVRMLTSQPGHQIGLWFAKLDDVLGAHGAQKLDLFETASPVRLFWTKGPLLQQTFVVPVTPGRWRLLGPQSTSLCVGGPVFDVKAGEAVFAGSFDAAADNQLIPDMSLGSVKSTLRDPALANRLTPAQWMNGETSPCGLAWAIYLYTFEMPGAPMVDDPVGPIH